jgi:O-6-methylguanine DNA methyltransferase
MKTSVCAYWLSPIGIIKLHATDKGISFLEFVDDFSFEKTNASKKQNFHLANAMAQLEQYFLGERRDFDLEFDLSGTNFQENVWQELCNIEFGKVISYKDLATNIGNHKACRAVGNANGKNPLPIIIPCHRVLASNGFGGYSAGLWRKRFLLEHENVLF